MWKKWHRRKAYDKLQFMLYEHAMNRRATTEIIRLLEQCPEAARIRDKNGNLLLHDYCKKRVTLDMMLVQALVNAYPESVETANSSGELPLHVMILYCTWLDNVQVIRFLIEKCPNALMVRWGLVLETPPQLLFSISCLEYTPNHVHDILSLVQFMFHACPDSARVSSRSQWTLLHVVCDNVCSFAPSNPEAYISLLQLVINMFPEAMNHPNSYGSVPLHVLCRSWSSYYSSNEDFQVIFRRVLDILSQTHESRTAMDKSGRNPLHLLCRLGAPKDVIMVLLAKDPSLASVGDKNGRTPLHCLLDRIQWHVGKSTYAPDFETVAPVVEALSVAACRPDQDGITPLQFAFENNLDVRYIYLLVRSDPMESLSSIGFQVRS